jgi:DNA-binding LacI/PurR family transcriptional regulator
MITKPGRPTIKEVAAAAEVSTQTVSRVINERPDVSPETRKRVQEVIEKLGYRPSALARSLIQQRSYTLGVVTAGLKFIGPSRTISGIAAAAEEAGYALLLKELPYSEEKNIELIFQALLSRHVDGIIWAVPEIGGNRSWVHHHFLDLAIPIVFMTMEPQEELSIVSVDNYLGGRMATSHLLEQGYRNIGHIAGPLDWWESRQRFAGWKDVLLEARLGCQEEHWVEGNWSSSSGAHAAERLFEQYPEMDAIFVANDQMALAVLQIAHQRGLRVPEDIGIVGFDNIVEAAYFWPSLTTIQQDQYQVARVAVDEIIKIIEFGWQGLDLLDPKPVILPPSLVIRQSSLRVSEGGDRRAK